MAITNLYSTYAYPVIPSSGLPIVAVMHGYAGSAYAPEDVLSRMARYGVFVISPGMRGRNGADGSKDASGREIYDIYDAIEYVKTNYASVVNADKVCVVGYSGGGGNALAFACKFPDAASVIVSHFGMSDYGWADVDAGLDDSWGWWRAGGAPETELGTPALNPNKYRARNAVEAIANFSGGHIYLYHDEDDASVIPMHSQRIATAMTGGNYTANYTTAASSPRWTHGNPVVGDPGEPNIQTESTWIAAVKSSAAWTIPSSGTVTVIGYIVTKRFAIWLNKNGTTPAGTDAAAVVVYNTATDTYTVTPLVSGIDVAITQGGKTGGATNINIETEIVVA